MLNGASDCAISLLTAYICSARQIALGAEQREGNECLLQVRYE